MLIDIPPPPPPPMAGCTVTLENSNVVVMCTSTNPSVMRYLVLLRFRDEDIDSISYHGGGWSNWEFYPVPIEMVEVTDVLTTSPPPTTSSLTVLLHLLN